jgi:hypothetical protein
MPVFGFFAGSSPATGLVMHMNEVKSFLSKFPSKNISIRNNTYEIYICYEDEDINLFEGVLLKKVNKKELEKLLRHKPPLSGYCLRFSILLYKNKYYITDHRQGKTVTTDKIDVYHIKSLIDSPKTFFYN